MKTFQHLILLLGLLSVPGFADVKLHDLFSDHMVLQRDAPVAVYGTGDEGEEVTVSIAGQTVKAVTKGGKWKAVLKPVKYGGPHALVVKGKNEITLTDILFGDVWLCGGQSNMQTEISYYKAPSRKFTMFDPIPGTTRLEKLRIFSVKKRAASVPEWNVTRPNEYSNGWAIAEGDAIVNCSATGYFFGKNLVENGDVPIGLLVSAYGGTSVQTWIDESTLASDPEFAVYRTEYDRYVANYDKNYSNYLVQVAAWKAKKAEGKDPGRAPDAPMGTNHVKRLFGLYKAMIAPLQEFKIAGAIWYQGESDSGRPILYRKFFPAMIEQWRRQWNQDDSSPVSKRDFPFLFVQLAGYMAVNAKPEDPNWAYLREAQTMSLRLPNTGMALAIDGGMEKDIHPPFKELVGNRLAALARNLTQGGKAVASGPMAVKAEFSGGTARVKYANVGSGLVAREVELDTHRLGADKLRGFAVCGDDKKFFWADATIEGDSVVLRSADVPEPKAVRYAWANFPLANLYNKEGFPAVPWRSDAFEPGEAGRLGGVAMGKPFVASHPNPRTAENGSWGGLVDGIADDGDRNCWSSDPSGTFPKTVTVDLKGRFAVSTIRVHDSTNGGTRDVEIAVSKDGESFTTVGKASFENYGSAIHETKGPFSGVTHVRLTFPNVHETSFRGQKNGFVFLRELEVQGVPEK